MHVRPDPDSPPGWGWIISASQFNENDRTFLAVLVVALTGHYGNRAGNPRPNLAHGTLPDYVNHKNPDTELLERTLADLVDRCGACKTRPVTKQVTWESDHTEGAARCCDDCVPLLEAKAQGGKFVSRDIKNAALVRELVARCGEGDDPTVADLGLGYDGMNEHFPEFISSDDAPHQCKEKACPVCKATSTDDDAS